LPVFKILSSPLICCFFFEKFGFIIDQWVHGNNILMGPCEVLGDSMKVRVHTAQNWKKRWPKGKFKSQDLNCLL
jgi:hypothetical protein